MYARAGQIYRNHNGSDYLCLEADRNTAVFERRSDGWTLTAYDIRFYANGTIEWDYSTNGHWTR